MYTLQFSKLYCTKWPNIISICIHYSSVYCTALNGLILLGKWSIVLQKYAHNCTQYTFTFNVHNIRKPKLIYIYDFNIFKRDSFSRQRNYLLKTRTR